MSTPPLNIIKNVQDEGYTRRNLRDLRKSDAFNQIDTGYGYGFVYEDGDLHVTIQEYVEEQRLEVETGVSPANLVPYDDMAVEQRTVRMEEERAEQVTQFLYRADPAVLAEVEAALQESATYEQPGTGSGLYTGGGARVTVNASRGRMAVFAAEDVPGLAELVPELVDQVELTEMTVLERRGPDRTKARFHAEAEDFVDVER